MIEYRAWNYEQKVMYKVGDDYGTTHPLDCCKYFMEGQPVKLLPYIGLKDYSGNKIFKHDVVLFDNTDIGGDLKSLYYVTFVNDLTIVPTPCFCLYNYEHGYIFDMLGSLKVIGNTYENELLNKIMAEA